MTQFLLLTSLVIVACVLSNKLTSKLGMPTLLAFILLGEIAKYFGLISI